MVHLSRHTYFLLFSMLSLVYIAGLFVPLMDNDSAHHANIALRMYLTGDYVNLVDNEKPYLDKPHLLFWLAAFSYKIWGVTGFAYKLPSFLFTIAGIYSTYRLGKILYGENTGRLAGLLLASSFAFILANNDVRMDAILTACIIFSTWQLVESVHKKKHLLHIGLAALGLGLGFSTKGHIAVFIPAIGILFYLVHKKNWKNILLPKWLLLILLFFVFITPVVYCYYSQYQLKGVQFILWQQNFERFGGGRFGSDGSKDYLFFFHTFLWAFAPWSIISFIALFHNIKKIFSGTVEMLTTGVVIIVILLITLSEFKLPHHMNIVFPFAALMTAGWLEKISAQGSWPKIINKIQLVVVTALLILLFIINVWAFPLQSVWIILALMVLLAVVFYFLNSKHSLVEKSIAFSVGAMIVLLFLLNTNFYPQLLKYQAGNELAKEVKSKMDPGRIFFWKDTYSSSFNFYLKSPRKTFDDSVLKSGLPVWLVYDKKNTPELTTHGFQFGKKISHVDYEITQLSLEFLDPGRRIDVLSELIVAEVLMR